MNEVRHPLDEPVSDALARWIEELAKDPAVIAAAEGPDFEQRVEEATEAALTRSSTALLDDLLRRAPEMLADRRGYRTGFEERLREIWGEALDLFEVFHAVCLEAGEDFNERHRPAAAAARDCCFDVLARLHARSCLVASEVLLTLLRSGYALGAQLVTRLGVKPVLVAGMTALSAGLIYFTQVSPHGSYLSDLLPGFLLIAVGLGFSFVPISIAALAGVQPAEAGLASGLINMSQQIGGALGIAALSAIATSTTSDSIASGTATATALTDGFQAAFMGATAVALAGILVALVLVRRADLAAAPEAVEPTPALEAA